MTVGNLQTKIMRCMRMMSYLKVMWILMLNLWTTNKGKEKIGVSNIEFEVKLERSNFEVDCMDSNDDASIHNGRENDHTRWPLFNPIYDYAKQKFEVGMLFSSNEEFKEVVQSWSIASRKAIKFYDKRSYRVICRRPNCPFLLYISKHEGSCSSQVRSLEEHTCSWTYHNKTLTSTIKSKNL
ncbi:hypothetical protein KFK09_012640 [Dendrobium nobile]|uniref:Transposase MuDR plant domain-containing protein n=1 Tax=Dendrobium nobile TaxID=94219 RepID=A0A8T3BG39_DENNO|nr:hypothetical protein KFK09_012640 [Dendrobium nobile]